MSRFLLFLAESVHSAVKQRAEKIALPGGRAAEK
jgi:hypothetical protein